MDAFIARQPIFDRGGVVQAYELLFRTGLEPVLSLADPEFATSKVIDGSLLLPGLAALAEGRDAFVNVTRDMMVNDLVSLLPPDHTVLEIVETVEPEEAVLAACRRLRAGGYRLALDDFMPASAWNRHLDLVDIVKVDVLALRAHERAALVRRLLPMKLTLVAEKVETPEARTEASALGYHLFQGYFFARPTTLSGRDIPASAASCLALLREIRRPELDLRALDAVVQREVALTYKLLRYVNSALFGWRGAVRSVDHALQLLGERELRRWAAVVAVAAMAPGMPDELVRLALLRGRLCELLAPLTGHRARAGDLFLMGLFSVVDAILDMPMERLLEHIPLEPDVKDALLGEPGGLRDVLDLAVACASGDWDRLAAPAARLSVPEPELAGLGAKALLWCGSAFGDGSERLAA